MSENATPRTAKQQFDDALEDDKISPLERLRFFCSLAFKEPQDWLDVESFFDDIEREFAAANARIAELEKVIGEHNDGCVASCRARTCGYKKADGVTLIYGQRRCPECPIDWMIEEAALAAMSAKEKP